MTRSTLLALSLSLATPLAAQSLSLDKTGGGLAGTATFNLAGQPNAEYLLIIALSEQQTPLPNLGITLDINVDFVGSSYVIPGFNGYLSAGPGTASTSLVFPAFQPFESVIFSMQAIADYGGGTYAASNLIRLTPQLVGTFKAPLNQPPVLIAGGGVATAADGELVFVGGSGPAAQRYASRTEEWTTAGTTFGVGLLSQTTGLADGRVLFTGGVDVTTGQPTSAAAIYDPIAQTTTTLAMGQARAGHGASLMNNGKVLITGGSSTATLTNPLSLFTGITNTTEIFDPVTNTFAPGPNMLEARSMHTSTTAAAGRVLIAGGITLIPIVNLPTVSATAYLFNPATNSFGFPTTFSGGRFLHSACALSNNKVLLCGGLSLDLTAFLVSQNPADIVVGTRTDCQVFTPIGSFGTFATVTGMQEGRAGAAIAPLPNGEALIAGGFQMAIDAGTSTFALNATATADRFAQGPNAITPTGAMGATRLFPVTANLRDGTVMIVGGGPGAEIYQP